jgi:hypothetical protein
MSALLNTTHRAHQARRDHPTRRGHEHRLLPREVPRGIRARGPELEQEILDVEQEQRRDRGTDAEDGRRADVADPGVCGILAGALDLAFEDAVFVHAVRGGDLGV